MPLMQWNDNLSVGVGTIDTQHKKLVELLNGLADAMQAGQGQQALERTLDELVNYTVTHFRHEEEAMDRTAFPGAAEHKKQHAELAKQALAVREKLRTGGAATLGFEVLAFLKNWLVQHIQGSDKKLGAHVAKFEAARKAG